MPTSENEGLIDQQRTLIELLQKEATRQGPTNAESNANAIEANVRALLLLQGKQPASM